VPPSDQTPIAAGLTSPTTTTTTTSSSFTPHNQLLFNCTSLPSYYPFLRSPVRKKEPPKSWLPSLPPPNIENFQKNLKTLRKSFLSSPACPSSPPSTFHPPLQQPPLLLDHYHHHPLFTSHSSDLIHPLHILFHCIVSYF